LSQSPDPLDEYGERFRRLRRRLEEALLPLATSIDGRHFTCQLSPHGLDVRTGGYVVIEDGGASRIGQILDLALIEVDGPELGPAAGSDSDAQLSTTVRIRAVRGAGVIRDGDGGPFHDGLMRSARPDEVATWLERTRARRAQLDVGELRLAPGVPFALDAGGFDRHTFLCGQSGSGKTYSLGVILERLLHETSLRIVVLDPNSDFVGLGRTRDGVAEHLVERHRGRAGVVVRSAGGVGTARLRLRFGDLDPRVQAAVLRLDPIADRGEYAELAALLETWRDAGEGMSLEELLAGGGTEARALGQRLGNLGVDEWGVWARDDPGSIVEELVDREARCLVVDLGSLATLEEKAVVSEAVLATLWRRRPDREPVLIVIDEAHNVCPSEPGDPVTAIATEHTIRIAAEGRKFGLYLLVSTQRPQKVHEQVLSQCDNLVLMRMNSRSDLAYVGELFSFVPAALVATATDADQGGALVAGKIASHPALIRFGSRITEEGGSDVATDWATPHS
jgi:DNA helicase HerA-like ATPase